MTPEALSRIEKKEGTMGETKTVVHDWRDIFRAFKMTFDPKKVFLGYIGLSLASIVWCVVAVTFFSALKLVSTNPYAFIKLALSSARKAYLSHIKKIPCWRLCPGFWGIYCSWGTRFWAARHLVVDRGSNYANRLSGLCQRRKCKFDGRLEICQKKILVLFLVTSGAGNRRPLLCPV